MNSVPTVAGELNGSCQISLASHNVRDLDEVSSGLARVLVGWLVGFVALRPKSTAMVIAGRSVHLTTLFPGQA